MLQSNLKLLNLGCGGHFHHGWVNVDCHALHPSVREHDLTKGIPFDNDSFDAVYYSHLLEHFSKDYALDFVKESWRILKPQGIVRVVVPDLERITCLYLEYLQQALGGNEIAQNRYEWIVLELIDQMVRHRPGGAMLEYWQQPRMPAEDFVIERMGAEVVGILRELRAQGPGRPCRSDNDPIEIGRFRCGGEVHQWMYDRYSLGRLLEAAGFTAIKVCQANESGISGFTDYCLDALPDGTVRKPDSLFMEARKPAADFCRSDIVDLLK